MQASLASGTDTLFRFKKREEDRAADEVLKKRLAPSIRDCCILFAATGALISEMGPGALNTWLISFKTIWNGTTIEYKMRGKTNSEPRSAHPFSSASKSFMLPSVDPWGRTMSL